MNIVQTLTSPCEVFSRGTLDIPTVRIPNSSPLSRLFDPCTSNTVEADLDVVYERLNRVEALRAEYGPWVQSKVQSFADDLRAQLDNMLWTFDQRMWRNPQTLFEDRRRKFHFLLRSKIGHYVEVGVRPKRFLLDVQCCTPHEEEQTSDHEVIMTTLRSSDSKRTISCVALIFLNYTNAGRLPSELFRSPCQLINGRCTECQDLLRRGSAPEMEIQSPASSRTHKYLWPAITLPETATRIHPRDDDMASSVDTRKRKQSAEGVGSRPKKTAVVNEGECSLACSKCFRAGLTTFKNPS